jgi:hypothetical protein
MRHIRFPNPKNVQRRVRSLGLAVGLLVSIQASEGGNADCSQQFASKEAPTGDDYLTPHFVAGQTYSDVFSILSSRRVDGYDEHAGRNGGSADYPVVSANPLVWRFKSASRYDGRPADQNESGWKDGGRSYYSVSADGNDKVEP